MPPQTVQAVVLLGWMERDQAVNLLTNECVSDQPMSANQAETLWREYRDRAEALPERNITMPVRLPLSAEEQHHAHRFMNFLHQIGARDVREVIKIDPMGLVVRQYSVVTERSENYRSQCTTPSAWMEVLLPTTLTNPAVSINYTQQNFDTAADIDIPHGEFFFGLMANGVFGPVQMLRHVTVMEAGQRMLLWAGYHRSYARMLSTTPTAADRSALVALASNTLVPPSNVTGVTQVGGAAGLDLWGRRPPLFADFFADGFFMNLRLRKKRYQLQVRSNWRALDV